MMIGQTESGKNTGLKNMLKKGLHTVLTKREQNTQNMKSKVKLVKRGPNIIKKKL